MTVRIFKVTEWRKVVPDLAELPKVVSAILDEHTQMMKCREGVRLFGSADPSDSIFLPIAGTIRIQRVSEAADTTVLYRLRAGESSLLAMVCQMSIEAREVEAVADTDAELLLVPRDAFDAIMSSSAEFRAHVFDACSKRITDLLVMIEDSVLAHFAARERQWTYEQRT